MSDATFIAIDGESQAVDSTSFNDLGVFFPKSLYLSLYFVLLAYHKLDTYIEVLQGLFLNTLLPIDRMYKQCLSVSIMESSWFLDIAATSESYKCDMLTETRSTG